MQIRIRRVVLTTLLLCGAAPAVAQAAKFPAADCPRYGDLRICTAQVPSFDGTAAGRGPDAARRARRRAAARTR